MRQIVTAILMAAWLASSTLAMAAERPVWPVKVSADGRYFVDQKGTPVFWLGTTQWLDFDSMQTWKSVELIYPMVTHDYNLKPVKPVLMAEGAYEHGSEYGFDVTPLWIRRQAYYWYLAGASHTYGHNDSWRVLPTWKQALDAPGAVQLRILKTIFTGLNEWWCLVPDQSIFAAGGQTQGQILNLAARHKDGRWVIIYLADKASFSLNLNKLGASKVAARWLDPRTGDATPAGSFSNTGVQSFSTPAGWEDALLLLEPAGV